jgi:hypothetical protein
LCTAPLQDENHAWPGPRAKRTTTHPEMTGAMIIVAPALSLVYARAPAELKTDY